MKFKDVIILIAMAAMMILMLTMDGHAQTYEDRILNLINAKRSSPLVMNVSFYGDTYDRCLELPQEFSLNDSCICDGEAIAGAESFDLLMFKLADDYTYDWIHYDPQAHYVSVAVIESGGIWYGVVRVWN